MQISNIGQSEIGHANDSVGRGIGNQFRVLGGLAILAASIMAFISLSTWSVLDPSLSHANGADARNWLGYPGAVFADLAMQFFGLASAIAIIPPALWGWWKLLNQHTDRLKTRIIVWPMAVIITCVCFACLPVPGSWPLPTGLGGVTGDVVLSVPQKLAGLELNALTKTAICLGAGFVALYLTLFTSGLIAPRLPDDYLEVSEDFDEFDEVGESSWALGALAHWYYSLRTRFSPLPEPDETFEPADHDPGLLARARNLYDRMTTPPDDGLEDFSAGQKHEPAFGGDDFQHPAYGENVYMDEAGNSACGEWAPQSAPDRAEITNSVHAQSSGRVQPMAPKPKASNRVTREAQPSLISNAEFELPSLHFLSKVPASAGDSTLSSEALEQNARLLEGVLEDFGVKGDIINVRPGPVVTLYELEPAPGIKSSRVIGLADDIARSMSAVAARVAVVPGRNAIGIELPNQRRETVYLREILESQAYETSKAKLPIILGKTIGGEATIADLAKMPHLLVAGTTGSGKSVAINTMILSILYRLSPEAVKMIMIDPKMLELSIYDGIPHLLTPVVTDPKKAVVALKWTVREMEERYKKMSKLGVRNIDGYNNRIERASKKGETLTRTIQTGFDRESGEAIYETETLELEAMPYIVVIIDEMADLMMVAGKDIEGTVQRLAQMARAAGIHVIMATQRPSVDVITGTIKANFPTRISFQVTSKIDSRTILGEQGAEQLLGMGDMLYMAGGGRIQRVHGPFVDDPEVEKVVNHLKTQGIPEYLDSVTEESEEESAPFGGIDGLSESNDIYDQAVAIVLRDRKVSTSYIQRRLSVGYNRAATLIERMEQEGLISEANHAGKREILVPAEDETI